MTKQEVRSQVLSKLMPFPDHLLWDLGAGCGSVAIEWMRTNPRCLAVAIEKSESRLKLIEQNSQELGVPMLSTTKGIDSLLSTVQMPAGVPVGTLAIGKAGAINSALFAISILGIKYPKILQKLKKYRSNFEKKIPKKPY